LLLGPASESTCEVAVIETPWLGAVLLPEVEAARFTDRTVS